MTRDESNAVSDRHQRGCDVGCAIESSDGGDDAGRLLASSRNVAALAASTGRNVVELPSIVEPGLAAELVRTTHGICAYSRAVRGKVAVALTANGIAVTEPVPAHAA